MGCVVCNNGSESAAALASSALNQILSYTPLVPNWAWHGSAYGMGDFGNNGFYRFDGGTERVLQHRSGLNSIPPRGVPRQRVRPLPAAPRRRLIGGVLTNIDSEGGANAMAFHSDPANLFFDPASGDWGLALYGHTHNTASFLVHHDDLGWLCYFCDVDVASAGGLTVTPRDSYRRRVFLASFGVLITSDAGVLQRVIWDPKYPARVQVVYAPVGAQPLTRFRLRLRGCGESSAYKFKVAGHTESRGAWDVAAAPAGGETTVDFSFGTHL